MTWKVWIVIAGATGIGDRGGLWADKAELVLFTEKEVGFSEIVAVCTVHEVSENFESI